MRTTARSAYSSLVVLGFAMAAQAGEVIELPSTVGPTDLAATLAALPSGVTLRARDQGRDAAFVAALVATKAPIGGLDLSGNPLGVTGAEALSSGGLDALSTLILADTDLGDGGIAALSTASFPALHTLVLDQCGVSRAGAGALARGPLLAPVRALSISGLSDLAEDEHSGPFLGPQGMVALARSANLDGLEELSVPLNAVGDRGAEAIATAPGLGSLRRLNLRANEIGDRGAKAILSSSTLTKLEHLDLTDNRISEDVIARLRERFGAGVDV